MFLTRRGHGASVLWSIRKLMCSGFQRTDCFSIVPNYIIQTLQCILWNRSQNANQRKMYKPETTELATSLSGFRLLNEMSCGLRSIILDTLLTKSQTVFNNFEKGILGSLVRQGRLSPLSSQAVPYFWNIRPHTALPVPCMQEILLTLVTFV